MHRMGEKLPKCIQVALEPTPNGGAFSLAINVGSRIEIHECDADGNSIYRTYMLNKKRPKLPWKESFKKIFKRDSSTLEEQLKLD